MNFFRETAIHTNMIFCGNKIANSFIMIYRDVTFLLDALRSTYC